jgi:hypothetical protein
LRQRIGEGRRGLFFLSQREEEERREKEKKKGEGREGERQGERPQISTLRGQLCLPRI